MRPSTLLRSAPLAALAAPLLASTALAAFDGDFALVDSGSPAGYYTLASDVSTLGRWSVGFFPAEGGSSFVDTTLAPSSVTLGASLQGEMCEFGEGETVLFIDIPHDGRVSFTIQVANSGAGDFLAGAEIYLSGVALYALTEPGATYVLDFDAFSGETLEFRSVVIAAGTASFASNTTTISNFTLAVSAIPEPSAFASLAGLVILGGVATRRRARVGAGAMPALRAAA